MSTPARSWPTYSMSQLRLARADRDDAKARARQLETVIRQVLDDPDLSDPYRTVLEAVLTQGETP